MCDARLDMTSYDRQETFALYVAVLRKSDPSPLLPESDEDPGVAAGRTAAADEAKAEGADSAAKAAPPVQIDVANLQQRVLPVPGVPLADDIRARPGRPPSLGGGLQTLVSSDAVCELAAEHGFTAPTAAECVGAAVAAGEAGEPLLDEIARRLALGVASVCVVLDPELIVLAGEVGQAGGDALTFRVAEAVARICPIHPKVVTTTVTEDPVLRGAVLAALHHAREAIFAGG